MITLNGQLTLMFSSYYLSLYTSGQFNAINNHGYFNSIILFLQLKLHNTFIFTEAHSTRKPVSFKCFHTTN
jgi:hypothetical protein